MESRFIPSEISILHLTIGTGFDKSVDVFHNFINPEILPLGSNGEARRCSMKTELPAPPNAMGHTYAEIVRKLDYFFSQYISNAVEFPLIFTMADDIKGCSEAMNVLYCNEQHVHKFCSMSALLAKIMNFKKTGMADITPTYAEFLFNQDIFLGTANIGCQVSIFCRELGIFVTVFFHFKLVS